MCNKYEQLENRLGKDEIDITETKTIGLTIGKVETMSTGIEIMTDQEIMTELDPVEVLTKYMS